MRRKRDNIKARLPKSVFIFGREYKIIINHSDDGSDPDETTLAHTDVLQGHIVIFPTLLKQDDRYIMQTILHEVLHAIIGESGIDCILDTMHKQFEEVVVNTLAAGLAPLIPTFFKLEHDE